jgi:hypothetical protein
MAKYLGTKVVDIKDTKFKYYKTNDWVLYFIEKYGQIDGSHHKQWVLDQIVRIIHGCKIEIKLASWDNDENEYRVNIISESKKYKNWVQDMLGKYNEDEQCFDYDYDKGIAP